MLDSVQRLAARFGVSWIITGGNTKLGGAERLADALRGLIHGPLQLVAYVDYDPWGWLIADGFAHHLARYGLEITSILHLVTPDRFTAAELRTLSRPLHGKRQEVTKVRNWVERSGGIGGKPRGIYANHLVPYERVEAAFRELTGLGLV